MNDKEIEKTVQKMTVDMAKSKSVKDVIKLAVDYLEFIESVEVKVWFSKNQDSEIVKKFTGAYVALLSKLLSFRR